MEAYWLVSPDSSGLLVVVLDRQDRASDCGGQPRSHDLDIMFVNISEAMKRLKVAHILSSYHQPVVIYSSTSDLPARPPWAKSRASETLTERRTITTILVLKVALHRYFNTSLAVLALRKRW